MVQMSINLSTLPVEIHRLIVDCCYQLSYDTLINLSLLNRYFHALVRPILTTSTDLIRLNCDEQKLQLYIHHFAPFHRTRLVNLSLVLSRTQIPNPYSLDDGLDEIYASILSLLPHLKTLHLLISSRSTKGDLDKEDFETTFQAITRLRRLESVRISGDHNPCSIIPHGAPQNSEFINRILFESMPRCQVLKRLHLSKLIVVIPSDLSQRFHRPSELRHLDLESVQITRLTLSNPVLDSLGQFVNFFSEKLESLNIWDVKLDLTLQPYPVDVPKLSKLGLSISKLSPDLRFLNQQSDLVQEEYHRELLYRDVLAYFENSELKSIRLPELIGLNQCKFLSDRGNFKHVYEIKQ